MFDNTMGVNLVPKISGFRMRNEKLSSRKWVCPSWLYITSGQHRVVRFNLDLHNIDDTDFHIGRPEDRPDVYIPVPWGTGWAFKEKFNTWWLTDDAGIEKRSGYLNEFCIMDFVPPFRYDCADQGLSGGSFDSSSGLLPCQFLEIDNRPDGRYTFHVSCNAYSVQQVKNGQKPLFEEDNYEDNTVSVQLQFAGDNDPVIVGGDTLAKEAEVQVKRERLRIKEEYENKMMSESK
jgi:hypothetical protein